MATVSNPFSPEEQDSSEEGTSVPVGGPQQGGVISPGANTATSPAKAKKPASSGAYNNIQKYINANKGFNAEQGGLAGKIVGNIGGQVQNTQQNLQGVSNAFKQQAEENVAKFNHQDVVGNALADPSAFVESANPEQMQAFTAARDAQYTGPKGIQDIQGAGAIRAQTANVKSLVNQGQSEAGRFNLLKQMFGNNQYSGGQQNLDNLLIQSDRGQMKKIQGARQAAAGLDNTFNKAGLQAQQTAQQNKSLADQIQSSTRSGLNRSVLDANKGVEERLQKTIQDQNQMVQKAREQLAAGNLDMDVYDALGGEKLGLKAGQHLYGVDPNSFINKGADPTAQQVASANDYARFNALSRLMGGVANTDASGVLQKFGDKTLAGTAGSGVSFDEGGFLNAINQAKTGYDTRVADTSRQATESAARLNQQIVDLDTKLANPFLVGSYGNKTLSQLEQMNSDPFFTGKNDVSFKTALDLHRSKSQVQQTQQLDAQNWQNALTQLQALMGKQLAITPRQVLVQGDSGATE